jgi:outer membrane protein
MKQLYIVLITAAACSTTANAKEWSLSNCIKYAQENNLTIKDNELNERLAALTLKQSKLAQLPSVNLTAAYGRDFSTIADPTTGANEAANFNFVDLIGNANLLVFGWFANRDLIEKKKFSLQAANADFDQVKQDVSLNVTTGYLRALQAKESITVSKNQVSLTAGQLGGARQEVRAGTISELGSLLLQAQLSRDSTNYLYAVSVYNSAMLDLKALLNLNISDDFEIISPDEELKAGDQLDVMSAEAIYATAIEKMGKIKSLDYNVSAAQKNYAAISALRYPSLSVVSEVTTLYTNIAKSYNVTGYNNVAVPGTYVNVNGSLVPVYQSSPVYDVQQASFGQQLNTNLSSIYALSLNVPLFNGWYAQYNTRSAKISMLSQKIKKDEGLLDLRRDIYKAYDEVKLAAQKYNSSRHATEVAKNALYFAQKRMSTGLMTTLEYLQVQNSAYAINEQLLAAKYDYIMKLKIIDYYMGRDLTM